jgi:hypothetical protein
MRNVYNILVGKPKGKRSLERPKHSREGNIQMDLKEIVYDVVDWIHEPQNGSQWRELVNTVMNFQVTVTFSCKTLFHGVRCLAASINCPLTSSFT